MVFRLVALTVLAAVLAASALAAQGPSLRVMRERPLVLQGAAFKPHEPVTVTVRSSGRTWTRRTHAGARGGFRVELRVRVDFCSTASRIVAQGRSSGTARARLPLRDCPIP